MHPISRRKLLAASMAAPPLSAAAWQPTRAGAKLKVIVCGGHPGDPEYGCGGTIARYTELGHDVALLYLNRGEKACPETTPNAGSDVRVPEARKPAAF
jgi:LmbE family N-acetylglucosaminyl deacetylase